MLVNGRLTGNADVKQLPGNRSVVNFTIAENHRYKAKGADGFTESTTFYNCSYWIGSGIAKVLRKGTVVELYGKIAANAYLNKQGEPRASINLHADTIRIVQMSGNKAEETMDSATSPEVVSEPIDDLPF